MITARPHNSAATRRRVCAALLVAALPVAVSQTTGATAPQSTPPAAGCVEVTALLDSLWGIGVALVGGDGSQLEATIGGLPDSVTAAAGAAPAELTAAIDQLTAATDTLLANLDGVDLTDTDAVGAAFGDDPATDEASATVEAWATENCSWSAPDLGFEIPDLAEPVECEELDATAAATAAGLEPMTDPRNTFDLNMFVVWVKACNYDNGLTLGTFTFSDVDDARDMILSSVPGAVVLDDVDLGDLPPDTLVYAIAEADSAETTPGSSAPIDMPPSVHVLVFDAPIPFEVQLEGDSSAEVIAAANALYATQANGGAASTVAAPATSTPG